MGRMNSATRIPADRPPIFTTARPWVVEPLLPRASAMGIMDRMVVRLVMRMGRSLVAPASIRAVFMSMVIRYWVHGVHIEDSVVHHRADQDQKSQQGGHADGDARQL